jgi:hypothetical protein
MSETDDDLNNLFADADEPLPDEDHFDQRTSTYSMEALRELVVHRQRLATIRKRVMKVIEALKDEQVRIKPRRELQLSTWWEVGFCVELNEASATERRGIVFLFTVQGVDEESDAQTLQNLSNYELQLTHFKHVAGNAPLIRSQQILLWEPCRQVLEVVIKNELQAIDRYVEMGGWHEMYLRADTWVPPWWR